jgi:hypothetical protein
MCHGANSAYEKCQYPILLNLSYILFDICIVEVEMKNTSQILKIITAILKQYILFFGIRFVAVSSRNNLTVLK